ncbi:4'-phosphopantetheinyl transferase family protein [Tateyamaria sp. SN3-11]|uniref:4'-phosphopantetheinyl transferase family protein n=1 Tax=Tateyamaria sp. SN3-11 TaxID=3092147 RepID=UPI0039EA11D0
MFIASQIQFEPPEPGCVFTGCSFDVSAYSPTFFDHFSIACPDSINASVPKRQAEFLAGRYLARAALDALGSPASHVGIGTHRQPLWPDGYSGSISHADGGAVALVAARRDRVIGVDLETILSAHTAQTVGPQILTQTEATWLPSSKGDYLANLTLIFSAKETLFKALNPRVGEFFDFHAAECVGEITSSKVSLALTQNLGATLSAGRVFEVSWRFWNGQVLTWLSAPWVEAP